MSYLPCKNPNCKSNGKPHPNCRCYGGMAEGGEINHFCDLKQPHQKECKYFAEGGDTDQTTDTSTESDFIPDNKFVPDHAMGPDFISDDKFVPDPDNSPEFIPDEQFVSDESKKYGTPAQQIGAGIEGVAQGFAGPLATLAEQKLSKLGVPGLSNEEIAGRQEENPWIHGIGETVGLGTGLATGVGEAGLAVKAAEKLLPEAIPVLGKVGAAALKAFTANAAIGAGNETTKAMLGQGDPEHPVASALANVGMSGLIGGLLEGGGAALASTEAKIGSKAASWLAGMGAKASGTEGTATELKLLERGLHDERAFQEGVKSYSKLLEGVSASGAGAGATAIGSTFGTPIGIASFSFLQKLLKRPVEAVGNLTVPTVTKWLSEGAPSELLPLLDYATKVQKGNKLLNKSVEALFKEGTQTISVPASREALKSIDDWIDKGGVDKDIQDEQYNQEAAPQGFAEGGVVKDQAQAKGVLHSNPVATVYPEQNIMLQTAKGRISSYLTGLKPKKDQPKLAFDMPADQTQQKKTYDKALNIAAQPMSILHELAKGTLDPEHVRHFNAMYPELNNVLQQKFNEQIAHAQLKDKRPSYKVRQGLSLLMGVPLSGDLTPQNIQAAQAVFRQQPQQQQPQGQNPQKPKSSTAKLTKSSQAFLTGNQSLVGRQQRQS